MPTGRAGSSKTLSDRDIFEIFSSDEEDGRACDIPVPSGSTFTTENVTSSSSSNGKAKGEPLERLPSRSKQTLGLDKIAQHEINFRKKEVLGMDPVGGRGRTLGTTKPSTKSVPMCGPSSAELSDRESTCWGCLVCTLQVLIPHSMIHFLTSVRIFFRNNDIGHLACSACGTPKGQRTWPDSQL